MLLWACTFPDQSLGDALSGGTAGGSGGSGGSGTAGADETTEGIDPNATCLDRRFVPAQAEWCDGVDNDGDSAIDEAQTGWDGFCATESMDTRPPCTYDPPLGTWIDAFDAQWQEDRAQTQALADGGNPCGGELIKKVALRIEALVLMAEVTDDAGYLDDAHDIATRLIDASVPFDPAWETPDDPALFDAWVAEQGELRYWDASACAPDGRLEFRFMIEELYGLRGLARLSQALEEREDARSGPIADYARQALAFYAMAGAGDPTNRLDSGLGKLTNYALATSALGSALADADLLAWSDAAAAIVRTHHEATGAFTRIVLDLDEPMVSASTSFANESSELVSQWYELGINDGETLLPGLVNTLLFSVWQADPSIVVEEAGGNAPPEQYPYLFRNFTDGDNSCYSGGSNPPYRGAVVVYGWIRLARYDARVFHLMAELTSGMLYGTVTGSFDAAGECAANGNVSYSYLLSALAHMARAQSEWVGRTEG